MPTFFRVLPVCYSAGRDASLCFEMAIDVFFLVTNLRDFHWYWASVLFHLLKRN